MEPAADSAGGEVQPPGECRRRARRPPLTGPSDQALDRLAGWYAIALRLGGAVLFTAVAVLAATKQTSGWWLGTLLAALCLWSAFFTWRVRQSGLTRFIAVTLLSGYVWLGAAGILALGSGAVAAGGRYDAMLHAVMLGFVFSMIFGHAPIIFPAVLGIGVAYHPAFYAHVALLHVSLLLRVTGDLAPWPAARAWGGLLNGIAIVAFLANTAYSALAPRATASPAPDRRS